MIIIDKPYVSKELKEYLQTSQTTVLKNDFSSLIKEEYDINLKDGADFKALARKNDAILTVSESSLKWIYDNIEDKSKIDGIKMMKNKTAVRKILSSLYPDFFFTEISADELKTKEFKEYKVPFVLKPSIGFFSMGVYTIFNENDFRAALKDIEANSENLSKGYSEEVIGKTLFIVEEYIDGEEYATDAYYDDDGKAVILNIFKHEFGSSRDVSDRLYYSDKEIIIQNLSEVSDFLNSVNKFFKVKNFPVHVEFRKRNGKIVPIEFNPMRFAGWCTTDLSYFAYGFKTYDYFFRKIKPDWNKLLNGKEDKIFSFILLNKTNSHDKTAVFDYELAVSKLEKVLCLRKVQDCESPVYGFIFAQTRKDNKTELEYMLKSDLSEFLKKE